MPTLKRRNSGFRYQHHLGVYDSKTMLPSKIAGSRERPCIYAIGFMDRCFQLTILYEVTWPSYPVDMLTWFMRNVYPYLDEWISLPKTLEVHRLYGILWRTFYLGMSQDCLLVRVIDLIESQFGCKLLFSCTVQYVPEHWYPTTFFHRTLIYTVAAWCRRDFPGSSCQSQLQLQYLCQWLTDNIMFEWKSAFQFRNYYYVQWGYWIMARERRTANGNMRQISSFSASASA